MRHLFSTTCIAALLSGAAQAATNDTTIQITNTDNAVGMSAAAGSTGTIVNTVNGKITVDETYAPTDADNDGDLDGPFAAGTGRYGIRTLGAFTGDVTNNGAITIEGNDSAGIALGGTLTGKLVTDGTITVTGDRSVGVRTGNVTGPVRLAGSISAKGQGASAAVIGGDVSGALVVQGSLTATGYRITALPSDTSKLDADDLRQGGPALSIAGNVGGGIILAVPPKDNSSTDNDEDKDGIEDSKEGSAAITSYGAAAAVQIGAADRAVTIGAVAGTGTGHGLVIDGAVLGSGVYSGVDGNGVVIGGLGGGVSIAGGMTVNGRVQASSNGASATAIRIGSGATVPQIRNAGLIEAAGANATGIRVDAGADVTSIANSGQIKATASGTSGKAVAIQDRSGQLSTIENSGSITASGGVTGQNIAIDLSLNTGGVTIGQTQVASGVAAPSITGDILLGSGNDVLDVADGSVTGTTRFNGGNNRLTVSARGTYSGQAVFGSGDDIMTLNGGGTFTGAVDFGGGQDALTLTSGSTFKGSFANSGGLALAITSGAVELDKGVVALRSLSIGASGVLSVALDAANHDATLFQLSGDANFAEGARIAVRLNGIANAEGRYTILQAGSISGASNLATTDTVLPFMFKSSLVATTPTSLAIDITRKTTTELGLNRSQASAYNAVYQALSKDAKVAGVFLSTVDGQDFRKKLRQMLPDHAGGAFESVTMGSRATASMISDPNAPFADRGRWGYWIQQVGWGTAKSLGDTASYDISGWGVATGAELKTGLGNVGLSVAYLYGKDADGGTANKVDANQFEAALYWRGNWGGLSAWTRGSIGHVDFTGKRRFVGTVGTEDVERRARGSWNGRLVSAAGGIAYEMVWGSFSLRPIAAVDYYRLREKGYTETGGGDAFNLIVARRTSDELALTGSVAAGFDFGGYDADSGWLRVEAEAGRRQLIGGSLGSTTARFAGGESFTLVPEDRTSGWIGKLRAVGGGNGFKIGGEAAAEEQQGRAAISLRASVMIGF